MEKVLKSILYILLIGLVVFAGYGIYRALQWMEPPSPDLILPPDSFTWHPLPPLVLPAHLMTNTKISNAVHEVNQYRTNEPYIAASNGRIWAGLHNRDWSISYKVDIPRHEAGIIVGGGHGFFYRFNPIGKLTVGGMVVWDGEKDISASAMIGWRW